MVTTGVLLIGWRSVLASVTPPKKVLPVWMMTAFKFHFHVNNTSEFPPHFCAVLWYPIAVLDKGLRQRSLACTRAHCPPGHAAVHLRPLPQVLEGAAQVASRKDKKGNPFEFIQLLVSLTKRW